jgi:long-subunit fatty acid transport protein
MGLYTYTITHDDLNNAYDADGLVRGGIKQTFEYNTSGRQQLYNLNFSGRYMEKLSLGLNINLHAIDYAEYKATEDIYLDNASSLSQVFFQQDLKTFGTGVSFQFGAIYKANDVIRLGLNYTSPTYYELEDEYTEGLETYYLDTTNTTQRAAIYPNVVNLNGPYKIKTAGKVQGSAALVLGKKGLLSVDYGKKNYGSSSVTLPYAADSNAINTEINTVLDNAAYLRIGGEGRIGDLSLRAGYWQEDSPYKNKAIMDDFSGFSLGMGIRFGSGSLDLAYTKSTQKYARQLYYTGLTDSVNVNENAGQVALTYSVRF